MVFHECSLSTKLRDMKTSHATILFLASTTEKGWTLLEIITVGLIVGILASIGTPSMIALSYKNKVQSGLAQVKGALQQAQRNAIKMGKQCEILLNTDTKPYSVEIYVPSGDPTKNLGCLSEKVILDDLEFNKNALGDLIRFSYKGGTTNLRTMVVYSPKTDTRHCLVVSNFLGIMRSGIYKNDPASSISATHCQSSL